MSQSNQSNMNIGCPECSGTVVAAVPSGPGLLGSDDSSRLRGTETTCANCGHEVELYYY